MSSITAIKNAILGNQTTTGTVVKISGAVMDISTPKGLVQVGVISGVNVGGRVSIKQGIITPLNSQKTPVFYL